MSAPELAILFTITKDNYLQYFTQNGSAKDNYDSNTGRQYLIASNNSIKVGSVTFNGAINLNKDFSVTGSMNFGKSVSPGEKRDRDKGGIADGIGITFYQGKRGQIGGVGGNLGIYGNPNSLGWKLDTWYNTELNPPLFGENDVGLVDPFGQEAYGAFISTDSDGNGYIDHKSIQKIPKDGLNQGQDNPVTFQY
ncbi:hypothetical protein EQ500_02095, partial [Lactobacillus sp. XV13L]|nr:hypothetical protein [Lactobacillus sp. XV13L]